MSRKKYPTDETKCIDYCICPYCGHKFNGQRAMNSDMDRGSITCPQCEKDMNVNISIEYMCTAIEE